MMSLPVPKKWYSPYQLHRTGIIIMSAPPGILLPCLENLLGRGGDFIQHGRDKGLGMRLQSMLAQLTNNLCSGATSESSISAPITYFITPCHTLPFWTSWYLALNIPEN